MPLTNQGAVLIAERVVGNGVPLDAANAYIGVGNGTTAFNKTQTDLTEQARFARE